MTQSGEMKSADVRRPSVAVPKFVELPVVQLTPSRADPEAEFRHLLDWLAKGVAAMEQIRDEQIREQVFALLDGVDIVHRQGLSRLLELCSASVGAETLQHITKDPVVHTLLDMYDLTGLPEVSEHEQVERALESVYPYIESHGGKLELLEVQDGRVRVRLSGSCGSCPGSSVTLQRVVEEALREGFPPFSELVAEDPAPPPRTLIQLGPTVLRRPRWVDVGFFQEFPSGEMRALWPEGQGVLLVRLDGEVYAHQNGCPPGSALALHLGELDGFTLVCPWHGCRYDIRTGKRLDAEGKLGVLPVAVKEGMVKVAMGLEEVAVP
ncbi:MAG: NifU family protein [Chloroflexota bacterium]|nr:MAG: hypothetical protein DLM70_11055 [Chloroflexota bacterium]